MTSKRQKGNPAIRKSKALRNNIQKRSIILLNIFSLALSTFLTTTPTPLTFTKQNKLKIATSLSHSSNIFSSFHKNWIVVGLQDDDFSIFSSKNPMRLLTKINPGISSAILQSSFFSDTDYSVIGFLEEQAKTLKIFRTSIGLDQLDMKGVIQLPGLGENIETFELISPTEVLVLDNVGFIRILDLDFSSILSFTEKKWESTHPLLEGVFISGKSSVQFVYGLTKYSRKVSCFDRTVSGSARLKESGGYSNINELRLDNDREIALGGQIGIEQGSRVILFDFTSAAVPVLGFYDAPEEIRSIKYSSDFNSFIIMMEGVIHFLETQDKLNLKLFTIDNNDNEKYLDFSVIDEGSKALVYLNGDGEMSFLRVCSSCPGETNQFLGCEERGKFYNGGTLLCESCNGECLDCEGPGSSQCLSCNSGFALKNSNCMQCHDSCLTCSDSGPSMCNSCMVDSVFIPTSGSNGSCCKVNDKEYVEDGVCKACSNGCKVCIGGGEEDCIVSSVEKVRDSMETKAKCYEEEDYNRNYEECHDLGVARFVSAQKYISWFTMDIMTTFLAKDREAVANHIKYLVEENKEIFKIEIKNATEDEDYTLTTDYLENEKVFLTKITFKRVISEVEFKLFPLHHNLNEDLSKLTTFDAQNGHFKAADYESLKQIGVNKNSVSFTKKTNSVKFKAMMHYQLKQDKSRKLYIIGKIFGWLTKFIYIFVFIFNLLSFKFDINVRAMTSFCHLLNLNLTTTLSSYKYTKSSIRKYVENFYLDQSDSFLHLNVWMTRTDSPLPFYIQKEPNAPPETTIEFMNGSFMVMILTLALVYRKCYQRKHIKDGKIPKKGFWVIFSDYNFVTFFITASTLFVYTLAMIAIIDYKQNFKNGRTAFNVILIVASNFLSQIFIYEFFSLWFQAEKEFKNHYSLKTFVRLNLGLMMTLMKEGRNKVEQPNFDMLKFEEKFQTFEKMASMRKEDKKKPSDKGRRQMKPKHEMETQRKEAIDENDEIFGSDSEEEKRQKEPHDDDKLPKETERKFLLSRRIIVREDSQQKLSKRSSKSPPA